MKPRKRMSDHERDAILDRLERRDSENPKTTLKALSQEFGYSPSVICELDRKRRGLGRVSRKQREAVPNDA